MNILKNVGPQHDNKWVAADDEGNIIAFGENPRDVLEEAEKKGIPCPTFVFVPLPSLPFMYPHQIGYAHYVFSVLGDQSKGVSVPILPLSGYNATHSSH